MGKEQNASNPTAESQWSMGLWDLRSILKHMGMLGIANYLNDD